MKREPGEGLLDPLNLPLTAGDPRGWRKCCGGAGAPEPALLGSLGMGWGGSSEFFAIRKWRLLLTGSLAAPGLYLAPGLRLLRDFLPSLEQCLTQMAVWEIRGRKGSMEGCLLSVHMSLRV